MSENYAEYELAKVNGGSNLLKVKIADVSGGKTRWMGVTPETFAKIAEILRQAPEMQW